MIPKQPEQRQTLYADSMLALDPQAMICVAPQLLGEYTMQSQRSERATWCGIANIGTLFLRVAEGSETLGDIDRQGEIYLDTASRIYTEFEKRAWPVYDVTAQDKERLRSLSITQTQFPTIAFVMSSFRSLYGMRGGANGARNDQINGANSYPPRSRLPFISDMDPHSRRYLELLWGGVQLHFNPERTLTPDVLSGGRRRRLSTQQASKVRTASFTTRTLTRPALQQTLIRCRE